MLAERFTEFEQDRQRADSARAAARAGQDAFIAAQMPAMTAAHGAAVQRVSGIHPRLTVQQTTSTRPFPTRSFGTLSLTTTAVRSTLYGPAETVTFVPDLQFTERDQFGIMRVVLDGLDAPSLAPQVEGILRRGLVLRGTTATNAEVVLLRADGWVRLTDEILERFLCDLLIRT